MQRQKPKKVGLPLGGWRAPCYIQTRPSWPVPAFLLVNFPFEDANANLIF